MLPVGDERRPRVGRAIVANLFVAGTFEAFVYGVKVFRPLGDHVPWMSDPFDVPTRRIVARTRARPVTAAALLAADGSMSG